MDKYADLELVRLWQQGEVVAFEALYKRYVVEMVTTATRKTGCTEVAKELVQDVFLKVYLHKDALQKTISLKGYLFTALKNRIFNFYRQQLAQQKLEEVLYQNIKQSSNDVQNYIEYKELLQRVQAKIKELPPQCRTVYLLSRQDQLSHKEISNLLNISTNTVEQHIKKALRILRTSMGLFLLLIVKLLN